jgi:hypothetical protein
VLSNWTALSFSIDEPLDRASMARSKFPALDGLFLISPSACYEPSFSLARMNYENIIYLLMWTISA